MKIYILNREGQIGYDEYDSMIVCAKTPKEARDIARENCGDEGAVWNDPELSTCKILKPGKTSAVILGSYNAG